VTTPRGERPGDALSGGPRERTGARGVRRRGTTIAAALVVAAVAVALAAPRLSLHADGPAAGDRPAGSATASGQPLGDAAVRWPLRGDLASDDDFVQAAMRRLRRDRPGVSRPLFAGRLPDGSRLLLAANEVKPGLFVTSVSALHVAARHASTTGTVSSVAALTDPAQALGWATVGRDGEVYALAMGPPRPLRLEMSGRVEFGDDGVPTRRWQRLETPDGVVVVSLGRRTDPAVAVRSLGPATFATPVLIPVSGRGVTAPQNVFVGGTFARSYLGPEPAQLTQGLVADTRELLDLGDTTQEVIWSGKPTNQRRFALVLITRGDGLRFQALVGQQAGSWFPAGLRALPAGAPVQLPWLLEPFSPNDPTQLLCPTGRGHLNYRQRGLPVSRVPIDDQGVATLLEPSNSSVRTNGARVTMFDPQGRRLFSAVIPDTGFDDPLALDRR
jgi:hypothetical protein